MIIEYWVVFYDVRVDSLEIGEFVFFWWFFLSVYLFLKYFFRRINSSIKKGGNYV